MSRKPMLSPFAIEIRPERERGQVVAYLTDNGARIGVVGSIHIAMCDTDKSIFHDWVTFIEGAFKKYCVAISPELEPKNMHYQRYGAADIN